MTASVPTYSSCEGGLILNSNKFAQLNTPGAATKLRNMEVSLKGGYRRINGHVKFGGASATRPNGDTPILGVFPYALGIVVCVGTEVHYTEDGITWVQINRDTSESGVTEANLSSQALLDRPNQGKAQFVLAKGTIDHATNPYGVLYIATGNDPVIHFHIDGTGASRTFHYVESSVPAAGDYIEGFDHHLCVVDTTNNPNEIFYSDIDDYDNFSGGTSGSVRLADRIVGLRAFRDSLYIFCQNSIHRLVNINNPATTEIMPVTGNLGCVSGDSIQEVGGDLVFLAPDGLRTVAGTARLSDVELSSISKPIQPLLNTVIENIDSFTMSSVVLREKSQYRLFYTDSAGNGNGFTGTLRTSPEGVTGFQWSEIRGIDVYSLDSSFNNVGIETTYHGSSDGYVHLHNSGNSFDGGNIEAEYEAPDTHFGDLGLRKTLHYMNLSLTNGSAISLLTTVNFDFGSNSVAQPPPFTISIDIAPAVFGAATFGSATFGQTTEPLERIPLQGSGHSVSYKFYSNDTSAPYIIHGFHTELMPSGRK